MIMIDGELDAPLSILAALFVVPFLIAYFLVKNVRKLHRKNYIQKYFKMYADITVYRRGKFTILYLPLFFMRRWVTLILPVIFKGLAAI